MDTEKKEEAIIKVNCALIDLKVDTEQVEIKPGESFMEIILKSKNLQKRLIFIVVLIVVVIIL